MRLRQILYLNSKSKRSICLFAYFNDVMTGSLHRGTGVLHRVLQDKRGGGSLPPSQNPRIEPSCALANEDVKRIGTLQISSMMRLTMEWWWYKSLQFLATIQQSTGTRKAVVLLVVFDVCIRGRHFEPTEFYPNFGIPVYDSRTTEGCRVKMSPATHFGACVVDAT